MIVKVSTSSKTLVTAQVLYIHSEYSYTCQLHSIATKVYPFILYSKRYVNSKSTFTEIRPDDARVVDYEPSEDLPPSLDAGVMEHYLDVGYVSVRIFILPFISFFY